jgi:hypothetical protein
MKITKILAVLSMILCTGCCLSRSYAKPQEKFLPYKKIAVIKFYNPKDTAAGQEIADIVAVEFMNHGFAVVGNSQITPLIDQNELYVAGMTQDVKTKLEQAGIDALVMGTVNEYYCTNTESGRTFWSLAGKNVCSVTLTAQLLDVNSGQIHWGTTVSESRDGADMTTKKVLLSLTKKIHSAIPDAPLKTPAQK